MEIKPDETDMSGSWIVRGGKVAGDPVTRRIERLVSKYLHEVGQSDNGWDTLYRDPVDGRYWELTYPESHMHGGGPPRLTYLSHEQVRERYGNIIT
jgi:Immunity protein 27